jgi:hypothetical protein
MEISSKEDYNIDSAFLQMIQEIHMRNIQESLKNTNSNNNNLSMNKKSSYSESKSKCCGLG